MHDDDGPATSSILDFAEGPFLCRFLGRRPVVGVGALGLARVREAPRHEIAELGVRPSLRPYGDLS